MKSMRTIRLKPNPAGKDRTRHGGATAAQLGAEWVDLKNDGTTTAVITGLSLYHVAYSGATDAGTWEKVTGFTGRLAAGKVIRLHSGSGPVNALNHADLQGADVHLFTNRNSYIWNNDRGDIAALRKDGEKEFFDRAAYDARPPEGVVLVRAGDKLVAPVASTAMAGGRR